MSTKESRVVVIGGGAIGTAVAFWLLRAGLRVTLVDRDGPGLNASANNAGNLNPLFMTPAALIRFALESFRLHLELIKELAALGCADYDLQPVRRILLAFRAPEAADFKNIAELFNEHPGFSARVVEGSELRRSEPRLSPDVQAGLLLEGNLSLNPTGFMHSLRSGAARLGADLVRGSVRGFKTEHTQVNGVATEVGEISCDTVVLATGPWVAEIQEWLGFSLPVRPLMGQMLRMKMPAHGFGCDFTHGSVSVYRRGGDEVWVGTTQEDVGFEMTPTKEGRRKLQGAAERIIPAMADTELLDHTAALRPMTPTGLPIVQRAPRWENVFVANGGGMKGILLCTGIAQAIARLVVRPEGALPPLQGVPEFETILH